MPLSFVNKMLLCFAGILLTCGIFYVSQAWSPSSYGLVLSKIGDAGDGLIAGLPQGIRSDEWAVYTPQIQATIQNHYQRFNATSYYNEDLRQIFSLPLHDWGMLFKPLQWGYLFLPAAYAYSLQWYFCFALFVFGYAWLLIRYGITSPALAIISSFLIYLSGFTQAWWTVVGPLLAIFPWVLLAATETKIRSSLLTFFILYWTFTSWLFSFFYPPFFISLSFIAVVLVMAFKREAMNRRLLIICLLAAAFACLTTLVYLKDYLIAVNHTIYPGARRVDGGGISWLDLTAMLIPSINIATTAPYAPLDVATNICEVSTVGSYFMLFLILFTDYRKPMSLHRKEAVNEMVIWIGLIILFSWMCFPIPRQLGEIFLFDRVPVLRMKFAAGILLFILLLYRHSKYGLRITASKWIAAGLFTLSAVYIFKLQHNPFHAHQTIFEYLFIIFCLYMLMMNWILKKYDLEKIALVSVVIFSLVVQTLIFGLFNPIQIAKPIFYPPRTPIIEALRVKQERFGYLEESDYAGSTLNGLGFRSVSHVLGMPMLPYWQNKYKNLDKDELNFIFNRYAHIVLSSNIKKPMLQSRGSVLIPQENKP